MTFSPGFLSRNQILSFPAWVWARRFDGSGFGAIEHQGRLLHDVKDADGGDDGRFGVVIDALQNQPVGGCGDGARDNGRNDKGGEEAHGRMAAKCRGDEPGQHCPQHEELAVGHVDHAHHAEDQRQAKRRQRQDGGPDCAFQYGEHEMGAEIHGGT